MADDLTEARETGDIPERILFNEIPKIVLAWHKKFDEELHEEILGIWGKKLPNENTDYDDKPVRVTDLLAILRQG